MQGFGWIMSIIIGGLAGWIAEKVMKFDTGLLMNIVLGIAGALVGNFLLNLVNISLGGSFFGAGPCSLPTAFRARFRRGFLVFDRHRMHTGEGEFAGGEAAEAAGACPQTAARAAIVICQALHLPQALAK